ncbi:MAG: COX15/CtaA family protein [Planctomycetaceae bacterium]|nr:COX15/CtaA family protein [Planctomycetaceae bacterium]
MSHEAPYPWLHRMAWLTAIIALLPISVGAVVTTVDAGMAFADWPTSRGQGMFQFPWWQSHGDEFLEHGHRLAGALTGMVTLALAGMAATTRCSREIRIVVAAILLVVILQGLLGGWRVVADRRVIALLHAVFAAVVFSLMAVLVLMTSRGWSMATVGEGPETRTALAGGIVLLVVLSIQYVLGSLLRHLGLAQAWLVHPWFALIVLAAAVVFCGLLMRTAAPGLRIAGWWVLGIVLAQGALGLLTWGVRYGFPEWGIMAVQQSPLQVAVRSLHKVLGLLTYMSTVVALARLWHASPPRGVGTDVVQTPLGLAAGGLT